MRDGLKGTWALAAGSRGSGQTSAPKEDAGDPVKVAEQATESVKAVGFMDCSLPGFSIHGIFQARVLEWGAIAFSVSSLKKMK